MGVDIYTDIMKQVLAIYMLELYKFFEIMYYTCTK